MAPSSLKMFGGAMPIAALALFGFIWSAHNHPAAADEADRVEAAQEPPRLLSPDERRMVHLAAVDRPKASIHVYFDSSSAAITSRAEAQLDIIGKVLSGAQFGRTVFLLACHTDALGSDEYNQKLSERRASAVKSYLITKFKIPAENLVAAGLGKRDLVAPAHPYAADNNRIEIVNLGSASNQAER